VKKNLIGSDLTELWSWFAGGTVCAYLPGQQRRDDVVCSAVLAETWDLAAAEQDASGQFTFMHTHTHNGLLSRTAQVGRYQKKHSSTHTHPDHRTYFFIFLHLLGSSLFSLRAWQSSLTTSLQVLVGFPLGLGPSTSYSMHFFSQSWSYFLNTCPYHHRLFCCNTNAMSSIPNLSLSSLLGNLDLLA